MKYLSRYTHRVAISNRRLVSLQDGHVRFRWKDYQAGGCMRVMTLTAHEFLRRFLLHVLPRGFHRIRHYGFLGNRCRRAKVERCRELINAPTSHPSDAIARVDAILPCPECGRGKMVFVRIVRSLTGLAVAGSRPIEDTS